MKKAKLYHALSQIAFLSSIGALFVGANSTASNTIPTWAILVFSGCLIGSLVLLFMGVLEQVSDPGK